MRTAVHISHETAKKIGGIGAVLNGMCTTDAYKGYFEKTLFYGPLFGNRTDAAANMAETGELLFSSSNGHGAREYGGLFDKVVEKYNTDIVFGKRSLVDDFDTSKKNAVDVVLVGITAMRQPEVAKFKYRLWEKFGIQSDLYRNDSDYDQYVRIAIPLLEIVEGLYGTGAQEYVEHGVSGYLAQDADEMARYIPDALRLDPAAVRRSVLDRGLTCASQAMLMEYLLEVVRQGERW